MTRMDIAEVSQEKVLGGGYIAENLFAYYEKVPVKKTWEGTVDGETKFVCGFCADENCMACEVWMELIDYTLAPSSVAYIRDLLEYLRVRYELRHILASAIKGSPTKRRFLEWLGFVDMAYESVDINGNTIEYFIFKGR